MKLSVVCVAASSLFASFSASAGTVAAPVAAVAAGVFAQANEQPAGEKPAQPADPAQPAQPEQPKEETVVYVKMSTTIGTGAQPDIILELTTEKAPISVDNFMKYVEKGYYDGTIFHRVIPDFMIQGGGFDKDLREKPGREKAIKNEWKNGLKNVRGSIAMARTAIADSATSQFFINVKDNPFLDEPRDGAAYAVFGKVVAGMATVDKIRAARTGPRSNMQDVPVETITITKVAKITPEDAKAAVEAEKSGASTGG